MSQLPSCRRANIAALRVVNGPGSLLVPLGLIVCSSFQGNAVATSNYIPIHFFEDNSYLLEPNHLQA